MFKLINDKNNRRIASIVENMKTSSISDIVSELGSLISLIREDIPEKKRISYGRYSIIKQLGFILYPFLEDSEINIIQFTGKIFNEPKHDQFVRSLAVQLMSIYAFETGNLHKVLRIFEKAAIDQNWEVRECSAGFIRKLIKKFPDKMKHWYLEQVRSDNPMMRRFVSESLRPVADNKWLKDHRAYVFQIIETLYTESAPYPRTSVGNSLSDWARIDKEKVYKILIKLVTSKNKNSYWIAYRACRNLVKNEPIRVMELLNTDEYKYKNRIYYRKDYQPE